MAKGTTLSIAGRAYSRRKSMGYVTQAVGPLNVPTRKLGSCQFGVCRNRKVGQKFFPIASRGQERTQAYTLGVKLHGDLMDCVNLDLKSSVLTVVTNYLNCWLISGVAVW